MIRGHHFEASDLISSYYNYAAVNFKEIRGESGFVVIIVTFMRLYECSVSVCLYARVCLRMVWYIYGMVYCVWYGRLNAFEVSKGFAEEGPT